MTNDERAPFRLKHEIDPKQDHVRGGAVEGGVTVVSYGDFLCPYCRRLRPVIDQLREALGDRLIYVFRQFPNEGAHPGAELVARATEAAAEQGRFWEMHDLVFARDLPIDRDVLLDLAKELELDLDRFTADLVSEDVKRRVDDDLAEGRDNGVSGTPTMFADGILYDGAWEFYSMLESLERPVAARVKRAGRVFASLPASGGLVLLLAAVLAVTLANSPLGDRYHELITSDFSIGSPRLLSMSVGAWCSEGLLAIFFLLVGLEIRRELTAGALTDRRAAILPMVAALGGVVTPAVLYLAINRGTIGATGWSVPTATDVAFTLGILALLGERIPATLRVFVAALAVVDDVLSVLILAIFYPHSFEPLWLLGSMLTVALLMVFNRWRVYARWPYALVTLVLWFTLHHAGVHGALAGVLLAAVLPTQPAPAPGPLLAQAANALAALDHAERELQKRNKTRKGGEPARVEEEPVWDWASRNLSAASERLLSPADRIERSLAPWSAYVVLPLFAFSATGIKLRLDMSNGASTHVLLGVVVGLVIGKPLGIGLASWLAITTGAAVRPRGVTVRQFIGAACLCGVADTVALLMADQAEMPESLASVAKIGCVVGSAVAAAVGASVLFGSASQHPKAG